MSFASKYNRNRIFDVDTTGYEYKSGEELYKADPDAVYPVRALYINTKGKFGDSPVAATDGYFVNMPAHMTDIVREILQDENAVADIKNGKVGVRFYKYHQNTYNRDCYGVEFVDL